MLYNMCSLINITLLSYKTYLFILTFQPRNSNKKLHCSLVTKRLKSPQYLYRKTTFIYGIIQFYGFHVFHLFCGFNKLLLHLHLGFALTTCVHSECPRSERFVNLITLEKGCSYCKIKVTV